MKRKLQIIGSCLGIIASSLLIYNSISSIVNSSKHGTLDIFDSILLPFVILLMSFYIIILINAIKKNSLKSKFFTILTIVLAFIIGLFYVWFAIVKSDNNLFYGIVGGITTLTAILLLIKRN